MSRSKIQLEYILRASPEILYKFLSTPACLVRWFCDEVDITGDEFEFYWDDESEVATLIDDIEEERLKFMWEDAAPNEFLQFYFYRSGVTNETILEITDFCDKGEEDAQKDLWDSQIASMVKEMGG